MPWLGVADTKVSPAGNRSVTCTPVAASGPLLVSVTVKVMVSPTLGVGSLTVLGDREVGLLGRLGDAGAVVAGVGIELVGVGDRRRVGWRIGVTTVATISSVCGRVGDGADGPQAGDLVVGALAGRRADTKVSPAGSRSVTWTPVAASGPLLVKRDGEGDLVADVGRGVAHRLVEGQVGLLGRLGGWPVLLPCWGRTGRRR